jgi:hypothetical protein
LYYFLLILIVTVALLAGSCFGSSNPFGSELPLGVAGNSGNGITGDNGAFITADSSF